MFSSGSGRRGGFGGGRHSGSEHLGRMFAHGDLHLIVLHLIDEKPRHGYEVIKAIAALVNGAYTPSPGTIYPALTLLEEQGYVLAQACEGKKKLHTITDAGRAYLASNRDNIARMLERIAGIGTSPTDAPPPQVIRAVENLKLALRMRLEREPLGPGEIRAITDALDRAVGEIEHS